MHHLLLEVAAKIMMKKMHLNRAFVFPVYLRKPFSHIAI